MHKSKKTLTDLSVIRGTPSRVRTCDLRLRSPLLYPTELSGHVKYYSKTDVICYNISSRGRRIMANMPAFQASDESSILSARTRI